MITPSPGGAMAGTDGTAGTSDGHGGHGGAAPGTLCCPRCGREDQVTAVPAAYLAAKSTIRDEWSDEDNNRRTSVREANSALANALAPAPKEPDTGSVGCWGATLVLVSIGTFVWGAIAGGWFGRESGGWWVEQDGGDRRFVTELPMAYLAWISGIAILAAVALFCAMLRVETAHRRRTAAGRTAAERLWSEGWFCARCAGVYFGRTGEDRGPSLNLRDFRIRVWEAGGYGDLVARHPTT
ncbi:hypothetical protein OHS33_04130 [Streptomyces sp. NBC_00536]|uniref:hypothetical protein n=1 Tax=Streptomyces sp. NBC_00536 TaxID=2975769 RepID=UPI002E8167E0|nr:hypothetical protein [Streptomyces sp. NBC_00536]WUC77597.1 hypothetical protein OHS33_04130 [Streptomyces sp. NBC_00536]